MINANRKINQTASTCHKTRGIRDATLSIISVSSLYLQIDRIAVPPIIYSIWGILFFLLFAVLLDPFAVCLFRDPLLQATSFAVFRSISIQFCSHIELFAL